jgi:hypothetical protein
MSTNADYEARRDAYVLIRATILEDAEAVEAVVKHCDQKAVLRLLADIVAAEAVVGAWLRRPDRGGEWEATVDRVVRQQTSAIAALHELERRQP